MSGLKQTLLDGDLLQLGGLAGHDRACVLGDEIDRPIPPCCAKEPGDVLFVEAPSYDSCGVSGHDGVWVHIARDDAGGRYDSAVTNRHAREHERLVAEPDVVADRGVAAAWCAHYKVHC